MFVCLTDLGNDGRWSLLRYIENIQARLRRFHRCRDALFDSAVSLGSVVPSASFAVLLCAAWCGKPAAMVADTVMETTFVGLVSAPAAIALRRESSSLLKLTGWSDPG